jgi:hypothetical protein
MKSLVAVALSATLFSVAMLAPVSGHAQFVTGAKPSSKPVSGCIDLTLIPALTNGNCGTNPAGAGQFAGSVWVANVDAAGNILSGSNWIKSATPNTVVPLAGGGSAAFVNVFTVTFASAFPVTPVCIASASMSPIFFSLNVPGKSGVAAVQPTVQAFQATTSQVLVITQPDGVGAPFSLLCSIGQ